jgi:hypothetical protein
MSTPLVSSAIAFECLRAWNANRNWRDEIRPNAGIGQKHPEQIAADALRQLCSPPQKT